MADNDFWSHQDMARKKSFRHIVLFCILLGAFSLLAALCLDLLWGAIAADVPEWRMDVTPVERVIRFLLMVLIILGIVALCTLFSPSSFSAGGRSVAESLQGEPIFADTDDPAKRRLLNVVEEMAIASGMPVPQVYLLPGDESINAFAAGRDVNDAVIGVTSGALIYLNREELQSVMAHEFSHILNGDMNVNLRFARLVFGLTCLMEIGKFIVRSASRMRSSGGKKDSGKGLILLIGAGCLLFGFFTALLGRIFQAKVNRQREFLADASSVQFTRTRALGSALCKIGGAGNTSLLTETPSAGVHSHLFFCRTEEGMFSTHPPLEERIKRLNPEWDGSFIAPSPVRVDPAEEARARSFFANQPGLFFSVVAETGMGASLTAAAQGEAAAPLEQAGHRVHRACGNTLDACRIILALLLDDDQAVREKQLQEADPVSRSAILEYRRDLDELAGQDPLELVEMAAPALRNLSPSQFASFQQTLDHFIHADGIFSFQEWAMYELLMTLAGPPEAKGRPVMRPGLGQRKKAARDLLCAVARLHPVQEEAQKAFAAGMSVLHMPSGPLPPKPEERELSRALYLLRGAGADFRESLMNAAACIVAEDGVITRDEAAFLKVLSLGLGLPIPEGNLRTAIKQAG